MRVYKCEVGETIGCLSAIKLLHNLSKIYNIKPEQAQKKICSIFKHLGKQRECYDVFKKL